MAGHSPFRLSNVGLEICLPVVERRVNDGKRTRIYGLLSSNTHPDAPDQSYYRETLSAPAIVALSLRSLLEGAFHVPQQCKMVAMPRSTSLERSG